MPTYGYQDWSRPSSGISTPILQDILNPPVGGKDYGGVYVGNWPYLMFNVQDQDAVAFLSLNLSWATNNVGNVVSGYNRFDIGPNQSASFILPVKSPYVDVKLGANVLNNGNPSQLLMYGTSSESGAVLDVSTSYAFVKDLSAYAVSQARTFGPLPWFWGDVLLSVHSNNAGPCNVTLEYWDIVAGAYIEFASVACFGSPSGVPVRLSFPPAPVRAVVNNGATAQSVAFGIIPIQGPGR